MCLINDVGFLARQTSLTSLTRRKNIMGPSLLTCAFMFHSVRGLLEVFLVNDYQGTTRRENLCALRYGASSGDRLTVTSDPFVLRKRPLAQASTWSQRGPLVAIDCPRHPLEILTSIGYPFLSGFERSFVTFLVLSLVPMSPLANYQHNPVAK